MMIMTQIANISSAVLHKLPRYILPMFALIVATQGCITETKRNIDDSAIDDPSPATSSVQSPSVGTLHALAKILASQGRDNECEEVLDQIIRRDPNYVPAYCDLSELYLRRNRMEDAITSLSNGLNRAPGDPILLNNLGMCRFLQKDYQAALQLFSQAAEVAPKRTTYLANKAMVLGILECYAESAAIYRAILYSEADVNHNIEILRNAQKQIKSDVPHLNKVPGESQS
jgi:Flp pilus assembly protein TadD